MERRPEVEEDRFVRVEFGVLSPNGLDPELLHWLRVQMERVWDIEVLYIEEKGVK